MKLLHTWSNIMKLLSSEITVQSILFPLKKNSQLSRLPNFYCISNSQKFIANYIIYFIFIDEYLNAYVR